MTQWADSSLERLAELWLVNRDLYASDSSLAAIDLFAAAPGGLPARPEVPAPAAGREGQGAAFRLGRKGVRTPVCTGERGPLPPGPSCSLGTAPPTVKS